MNRAAYYSHSPFFIRRAVALGAALLAALTLVTARPASATITSIIGFRGVLRSSGGSVVSDGNYSIIFVIYDASTSGTCLYTARGTCASPSAKTISVTNGFFQTLLGESDDNSLDLTFNTNSFYLELRVNGETMTPRRQLASASQAYNANRLGGLAASSVLQSDADDYVSGLLTYSLPPVGTGIGSGTVWLNPGSTSTNRTILGISAATSTLLLNLDSEGDLRILGNLAPYNNNWTALGAFGSAFTNAYSSGTAYLGTVSSTLMTPWSNSAGDLGVFGNAWRNSYVSGTLFGGTVSSTLITGYSNNASDLGIFGNAWRTLYASGSLLVGSQTASSSLTGGTAIVSAAFLPSANNTVDIGALGLAVRNIYASGTVTSAHHYPTLPATYDLGGFGGAALGAAWRNLYTSGTIFSGTVSSTLITPWTNNANDLGIYGNAWRNLYVSGTSFLGNVNASSTASSTFNHGLELRGVGSIGASGNLYPFTNDRYSLGASGTAWHDVFASGTVFSQSYYGQGITMTALQGITINGGSSGSGFTAGSSGLTLTGRPVLLTQGGASDVASTLVVTPAADTGATSGTETVDAHFNLDRELQHAAGAITNQRAFVIEPPIYSFVGASIITNAAALYVANAPVAGTNATIINNYALWIDDGVSRFDGPMNASSTFSVTGATSATTIYPWSNTLYDFGAFGTAWRDLYASRTAFLGTVSSTLITGYSNNAADLGVFGNAFRSLYVSGSLLVGGQSASSSLSGGTLIVSSGILPSNNNTVDIGAYGNAFRNVLVSGTVTSGHHYPTLHDTYDLGAWGGGPRGAAWRNLYVSDTIFGSAVSSTLITGYSNNSLDLGVLGLAIRNIYASGSVTAASIYPWNHNTYDLGGYGGAGVQGAAWRNLYVSGTSYLGSINASSTASSTFNHGFDLAGAGSLRIAGNIYPSSNNVYNLGNPGQAWNNVYVSSSLTIGGGAGTAFLIASSISPDRNNLGDLGAYGTAFRSLYASGTLFLGSGTASSSLNTALTLGQVGADRPLVIFSSTGTFRSSPVNATENAAFVFDTANDLTALGPTSTALLLLRENGVDRLAIIATSSDEVHFRSYVVSSTANKVSAFVFETVNIIGSSTFSMPSSNVLLSVRNRVDLADSSANIDPEFAVYAGGNVVADGSFTSNGTPGDVAEYVEVSGERVEPGDVLVVDDAADGTYRKSSGAYSKDVAGVVATTPKFIIGAPNGTNAPLVLVGLAKVKVTFENGAVSRGDLLVSSSRAGYAMRYDPATDTGSRLVAVLGVALEPLAVDEGLIQALVRNTWVNNVAPSVQKISRDLLRVANTVGVRIDPIVADRELSVRYGPDGGIASGVSRDLAGTSIAGVADIQGADGKWQITPDGTLIAYVETSRGTQKPYYALGSPDVEFVISGSGRLENGEARVEFDSDVHDTLDDRTLPKVVVTPLAPTALYVTDKSAVGFQVKSLAAGAMDAEFDWIAIVRRKGYGDEPEPPPPASDSPGVADVSLPAGQAGLRSEPPPASSEPDAATSSTPIILSSSDATTTPPLDVPPLEE